MAKLFTRRRLLVGAGVGALAVGGLTTAALIRYPPLRKRAAVPPDTRLRDFRVPSTDPSLPDMAIVEREASPAALTEAAVAALGGLRRFISKGDVVVLKPNVTWKRTPLQAANTNPEVVAVLVRLALEAGAKRVIVTDSPGLDATTKFEMSGVGKAASNAGAEVQMATGAEWFEEVPVRGQVLDNWPVLKSILTADKVINVPVAKQHGMRAFFSACLKNSFGMVGGDRMRLHWELDASIVDLSAFLRPTLNVVDATRVLIRNGPQSGNLDDVAQKNTVIASIDPVAADAFASSLIGIAPETVPHISLAQTRGLGTLDWQKLKVRRA